MECLVCSKLLEDGYLCEDHSRELYEMLTKGEGTIINPDWKSHCLICGEYQERVIVEFPSAGPFCNKDIVSEWERYQNKGKGK